MGEALLKVGVRVEAEPSEIRQEGGGAWCGGPGGQEPGLSPAAARGRREQLPQNPSACGGGRRPEEAQGPRGDVAAP